MDEKRIRESEYNFTNLLKKKIILKMSSKFSIYNRFSLTVTEK